MHSVADPISPTAAMPSRPAPPPSRHLLSSYGILFILLTMVSMVRHTFHMAQYHFVLFFPAFLAPFSRARQSGSICRHLWWHQISPDSSFPTSPGLVVPVNIS